MTSESRIFKQVDVFSSAPFMGNPVAVIFEADNLTSEQMQNIARWTNLSETTFLQKPINNKADYKVRIFTPNGELPFAGHPTLGTAHAWSENGGVSQDKNFLFQECESGLIKIKKNNGKLYFEAPATKRTGEIESEYPEQIVDSFGIKRSEVLSSQWVDNGPGWAVVQLESADNVLQLRPDLSKIPNAMVGAIGNYPSGSKFKYEMRTFAPAAGVSEDPVCGSMNASVAQWLHLNGETQGSYSVSQGSVIGRAGEIDILIDENGAIWVGGKTTTLFDGTANF